MAVQSTLADADRLQFISQRVGFALWQLQELEGVAATYLVLATRAKPGMGEDAGNALMQSALAKTFGATIRELTKAGKLPPDLEITVKDLLAERNWLVHESRASSRSAVRNDDACVAVVNRIDAIGDMALVLMRQFGALVDSVVKSYGVSTGEIDAHAADLLRKWRGGNAL